MGAFSKIVNRRKGPHHLVALLRTSTKSALHTSPILRILSQRMNNAASSSNFEKVKSGEEKVNQMAKVPDDGTLGKNSTTEGPASFFGSTSFSARGVASSIYRTVVAHLNSEEDTGSRFRSCNEFTI